MDVQDDAVPQNTLCRIEGRTAGGKHGVAVRHSGGAGGIVSGSRVAAGKSLRLFHPKVSADVGIDENVPRYMRQM